MLAESLDLNDSAHVVISGRQVGRLHLVVKVKLSVNKELFKEERHELDKLLSEEASALSQAILDGLILRVIVGESALNLRSEMLSDLNHIGLEWLLIFIIGNRSND